MIEFIIFVMAITNLILDPGFDDPDLWDIVGDGSITGGNFVLEPEDLGYLTPTGPGGIFLVTEAGTRYFWEMDIEYGDGDYVLIGGPLGSGLTSLGVGPDELMVFDLFEEIPAGHYEGTFIATGAFSIDFNYYAGNVSTCSPLPGSPLGPCVGNDVFITSFKMYTGQPDQEFIADHFNVVKIGRKHIVTNSRPIPRRRR